MYLDALFSYYKYLLLYWYHFYEMDIGKEDSRVALSGFRGVKDINHIFILFIYNMAFCPSSFSL